MKIQNGAAYENQYARAAAYYLATCAPEPAERSRREAYRLITGLYSVVFRDASAVGWKPLPDVSFAPWEQQKGREKDTKIIREPIAKIEGLVKELFDAVEAGEADPDGLLLPAGTPALKRALVKALAQAGTEVETGERIRIRMSGDCANALKELACISRAHIIPITDGPQEDKAYLYFSRCVFDPAENWTAKAFDALLNADGQLLRLCEALEARGYRRIDCRDGKKVSLDYVRQHGKKEEPVKWAWSERTHSGIEVSYEELRLEPCFLWLRMPMYKSVLAACDRLPERVVAFLADHTKTCDGCRYCVQTDRTGKRPLAAVPLDSRNKCPLYPGFTMNWRALSAERTEELLAVLDALDALPELA